MLNPISALLLASALLFLGTVGFLVVNAGSVAELIGWRRREAEPGDVVTDPHGRRRRASPAAIKTVLALHVLGIVGLVVSALALTGVTLHEDPAANPLPAEMDPLDDGV